MMKQVDYETARCAAEAKRAADLEAAEDGRVRPARVQPRIRSADRPGQEEEILLGQVPQGCEPDLAGDQRVSALCDGTRHL